MQCPYCNAEMVSGTVFLRAHVLGFLFRGFSHQPLWFQPDEGLMNERIVLRKHFLPGGDVKPAFRCESCSAVLFQGE